MYSPILNILIYIGNYRKPINPFKRTDKPFVPTSDSILGHDGNSQEQLDDG